jgi:hypothetical protein
MKKVFVIGATGGLGRHVLRDLLDRGGVEIVAFVRTPTKLDDMLNPRLHLVQGDFSSLIPAHLNGCDVAIATHSSSKNERHIGYENLVKIAAEAGVSRLIGVGGAGQLLMEDGQIKQSDPSWFPALAPVTEDHQRGLRAVRKSKLDWTWVAPPYMPTDAASAGGYIATNEVWNNAGMLPQVDVAQFIVDEIFEPKHLGHVVGLSARQPNETTGPR